MTTPDAADRVGAKLRDLYRDMPQDEGAILEALLIQAAQGIDDADVQGFIMGFMHMAAGTQDAMKRVLFGAAGVAGVAPAEGGTTQWFLAPEAPKP